MSLLGKLNSLSSAFFAGLKFVYIRTLGKAIPLFQTRYGTIAGVSNFYRIMGCLARSITYRYALRNGPIDHLRSSLDRSCSKLSPIFYRTKQPLSRGLCISTFAFHSYSYGISSGVVLFDVIITGKFVIGSLKIVSVNYFIFQRERAVKTIASA